MLSETYDENDIHPEIKTLTTRIHGTGDQPRKSCPLRPRCLSTAPGLGQSVTGSRQARFLRKVRSSTVARAIRSKKAKKENTARKVTVATSTSSLQHLVDDKLHARSWTRYSLVTSASLGRQVAVLRQRFGKWNAGLFRRTARPTPCRKMLTASPPTWRAEASTSRSYAASFTFESGIRIVPRDGDERVPLVLNVELEEGKHSLGRTAELFGQGSGTNILTRS